MKTRNRNALVRLAASLPKGSEDRRTILSALKAQMSGAGGWVVYNDKSDRDVAQGFADLDSAKRWIGDREALNRKTHNLLQDRITKGIKGLESWVAKLYLNDLNKAYNQMSDLEGAFNKMVSDVRDEYADYVQRSDYIEFYEDLDDAGFYGLEEAIEEVEHDLNEMIGNGWADDGYEDQVQEEIENQILPRFEDALDTFRAEYGKVPRVASTTRQGGGIPSNAPRQVKEVAKAWLESALKAAEEIIASEGETGSEAASTRRFWKGRLYVDEDMRDGKPAWSVGDNYDRSGYLHYYPDTDEWFYMAPYGSEKLIRGGFREALANAEIMWTG